MQSMTGGMKQTVIEADAAEAIRQDFDFFAVQNGVSSAVETQIRRTHLHGKFAQVVAETGR